MTGRLHFVATGYVVRDRKTLLLYHKKLRMWLPPGGHIDEGELPEEALLREIKEETGLKVEIVSPRRLSHPEDDHVRYLHVPNHVQLEDIGGEPPHRHIDLIYFCRARNGRTTISPKEHEGMRWHSAKDLAGAHLREEVRQSALAAIRYVARIRGPSLLKSPAG
ncbi:MAG: NUDIX domain-containing protein [Elusimicrobia bacterium]|nr:NUDIX domain-containing protein [Elusimicrobiota bacterium]